MTGATPFTVPSLVFIPIFSHLSAAIDILPLIYSIITIAYAGVFEELMRQWGLA